MSQQHQQTAGSELPFSIHKEGCSADALLVACCFQSMLSFLGKSCNTWQCHIHLYM